jgi:DNA-binding MarR family transcriptional regulator
MVPPRPQDAEHPFGKCLYFTANAVAREVTRLADEAFAPTGLCPSGGLLLKLVVDRPGIAPSEAAELLHLAPSSVTRFADGLVRKELVERRPEGRQMLLHPTRKGRQTLEKQVLRAWETLYASYSELVGKRRGEAAAAELTEIADALSQARV